MQEPKIEKQFFFVDEAGDPTFYNSEGKYIVGTEGCSKILLLGFIKTEKPHVLREAMLRLQKEIIGDPYLQKIPSLQKTAIAFHAKNDVPEVREKVFKVIVNLPFSAEFIVARKIESVFHNRHKGKEHVFYDNLIINLFQNKLHLAKQNSIYFAVRGNKHRQAPLEEAIQTAVNVFEQKWEMKNNASIQIFPQSPAGEPCLQIADYMNCAVQRAFQKGDDRYIQFLQQKIAFLCDMYDFDRYPKNFYSKKNPFDINKISPL